ncbi:redoxin domain-containing protein [Alteromonas oceanisediminis]|uniref:redoxin domain-containing protein n=1 Tax=Alteromonas oceanisediminis TaxID=2836180 RepID=UPI001BD99289|nr:redoxin domain-containing protein [Alteromonas oceanisediminis]MBT0585407.1 redoxin domain-containing protein [Alteromonas oceanisediminis]
MNTRTSLAGAIFSDIQVLTRDGETTSLIPRVTAGLSSEEQPSWFLIVVYRGQHCPICAKYLNQLQSREQDFAALNVQLVAVSADSVEQLNDFYADKIADVAFSVYAGLSKDEMQNLGLFLSEPMSASETDHVFAEPAMFLVNAERKIQIAEIASAPFVRPNLDQLIGGIKYVRENDYPIRGTA